jgi:thymidine kinase
MEYKAGSIEVICGPMCSGKSLELIRKIERCIIAKKKVIVFKPIKDTRDNGAIISRTGAKYEDIHIISHSDSILDKIVEFDKTSFDVVAIDEAQFFDDNIVGVVRILAYQYGIDVFISGLEKDYLGNPFGPMPQLLAIADTVTKLSAICMKCKKDGASFTYRIDKSNKEQIQVGGDSIYEARCCKCWQEE